MKISIYSAIGGGEPITMDVEPTSTIQWLKNEVAKRRNIPASIVIIVFKGQKLDDAATIKSSGLSDGDRCYMIARTVGGV